MIDEEHTDKEDDYFSAWLSDNKWELAKEFAKDNKMLLSDVETVEDEFMEFARDEYKKEMMTR